jgi:hypothetical protein
MKNFITLTILLLQTFSMAQTTLSSNLFGRDCIGGNGLCGGVEPIGAKSANNKTQTFYLVLNQDKLAAKELESVLKENEPLQYQVKTDWVLDSQTIAEHNLKPSKPVIKAGFYPIERIDGQLKILFTLMPLTAEKVNKK